jgi:hypothetical protein
MALRARRMGRALFEPFGVFLVFFATIIVLLFRLVVGGASRLG